MRTRHVAPREASPAKQELRHRIALSNRSRLTIGRERLDGIAAVLAGSKSDRTQFMDNPTSYLRGQSLPIESCKLVVGTRRRRRPQTAELVSAEVNCCVDAYCDSDADVTSYIDCIIVILCSLRIIIVASGIGPLAQNFDFGSESDVL